MNKRMTWLLFLNMICLANYMKNRLWRSTAETETWLSGPYNSTGGVPAWCRAIAGCKIEKVDRFKVEFETKAIKLNNYSVWRRNQRYIGVFWLEQLGDCLYLGDRASTRERTFWSWQVWDVYWISRWRQHFRKPDLRVWMYGLEIYSWGPCLLCLKPWARMEIIYAKRRIEKRSSDQSPNYQIFKSQSTQIDGQQQLGRRKTRMVWYHENGSAASVRISTLVCLLLYPVPGRYLTIGMMTDLTVQISNKKELFLKTH